MTDIQRAMLGNHEAAARLTDEAVDMMLERWKEAVDGETD